MTDDPLHTEVRYDSDTEAYLARMDLSGTIEPSVTIVSVLASITGDDPTDLADLRDAVDPGALDRLLIEGESRDASLRISFEFLDYAVTVTAAGEVHVEEGVGV